MNRSHDETSEALLAAAHRLLAESGPDSLTVRRIANEAGMSTMNVYSRFGGKDGVIDELYADGYRRLGIALGAVPTTDDTIADLGAIAVAYRRFANENPTYYGVMLGSTVHGFHPSQEATEISLSNLATLVDRVELGQERGVIKKPEGCKPIDIAAWLWATCHGLVSLELAGTGSELVDWAKVFENGIHATISTLEPAGKQASTS
jgi:AcrR family transcriptional regulator